MENALCNNLRSILAAALFVAAFGSAAFGQAQTFVATAGLDTNSCTATSPCATINHALSVTSSGGAVTILNSGVYAPFTVSKSVTVQAATGAVAEIAAPATDAIDINSGSSGVVMIRGLTIYNQGGSGTYGIRYTGGMALQIENCIVNGFSEAGIGIQAGGTVSIRNTITRNNYDGLYFELQPVTPQYFYGSLDNVKADANVTGIVVYATGSQLTTTLVAHNSTFSGNSQFGALIIGSSTNTPSLDFDSCAISDNGTGLAVGYGQFGQASISNCTISRNTYYGYVLEGSGILYSLGNNTLIGNASDVGSLTPLAAQ